MSSDDILAYYIARCQRLPHAEVYQRAGTLSSALFRDDATLLSILHGEGTLVRGEEGPAVTKVQRALVAAGYSLGRHGADGDLCGTT